MARPNKSAVASSYILRIRKTKEGIKQDRLPFQFLPDNISESKAAIYGDIITIGRSTPIKTYSHSASKNLNFTLKFFANPEKGDMSMTPKVIKERVDFCYSLLYPDYSAGFVLKPPPKCLIRIGDQITFAGICKTVTSNYNLEGPVPWDVGIAGSGVYAHGVQINLGFEQVREIPPSVEEVSEGLSDVKAGNSLVGDKLGSLGLPEELLKALFGTLNVNDIINILVSSGVQGNLSGGLNTILTNMGFSATNFISQNLSSFLTTQLKSIPGINNIPGIGGVTSYLSGNLNNIISTNIGSAVSSILPRR